MVWGTDFLTNADGCHGFKGHAAGAPDGPVFGLLCQDGTDQPGYGVLFGKYPNDLGAAFDPAVVALDRAGRVQFGAAGGGKAHTGQHILFGIRHCLFGPMRTMAHSMSVASLGILGQS